MNGYAENTEQAAKNGAEPKAKGKTKPTPRGGRPKGGTTWNFPKSPLEDAIRVAKAIEDKNAGNPMSADLIASAVGFNRADDWRFLDLLRSANMYGLVNGTGKTATVSLEKVGQDLVAPGSPDDRKKALLAAFHSVPDFKKVDEFYGKKKIPEDEYFLNTLTRQFGIPRDRADVFADIFRKNVRFLNTFNILTGAGPSESLEVPKDGEGTTATSSIQKDRRVREFLDTCFVMMPFGGWFDRYYQDIYVPAIKEVGLEPVRADELFSTGSVVEQIWEQIAKSRVLLADLTDRNANVFYELGLAHAAKKPVVFTAAKIDDVPFDLRHLRVVVYEVREPEWAAKLRKLVTEYLRNTIKDPMKSIPHPFRTSQEPAIPATAT